MKTSTTEQFIQKAIAVHGKDTYDYSKVEYVNSRIKVCITCKKHGDFWQAPNAHCGGEGCSLCANSRRGPPCYDLLGKKFGKLTVIEFLGTKYITGIKGSCWKCRCDCGNILNVAGSQLVSRHVVQCIKCREGIGRTSFISGGYRSINVEKGTETLYVVKPQTQKSNRIREHIYVMAKHLHRPIDTSRESVHHKDGDRSNNRLSNLELRKIYHPQGHTHKEKLISNAQYALDFFDELPVSMKREFQTRISSLKEAI